jgi:two-component system response regulator RegX3
MAQILVIEGRHLPRAAAVLAAENFAVVTALAGTEAVDTIEQLDPDIVAFELEKPDFRMLEVCRSVRAATLTPIVVLTDPCPEHDVIAAYSAGVDSVVIEPVGSHELIARVRALLRRRTATAPASDDRIEVGSITLDRARRELSVRGALVSVPRREFEIAEILMREAGRVVPRRSIVLELWGTMRGTKSLDVQVGRLRARFANVGVPDCITTIRGIGFRFATGEEMRHGAPSPLIATIDLRELDLRELEREPELGALSAAPGLINEPSVEETAAR